MDIQPKVSIFKSWERGTLRAFQPNVSIFKSSVGRTKTMLGSWLSPRLQNKKKKKEDKILSPLGAIMLHLFYLGVPLSAPSKCLVLKWCAHVLLTCFLEKNAI